MRTRLPRRNGFTLLELAVVLVIVSLLIGGMMMPLSAQNDLRNSTETTKSLNDLREALIGFALVHGYLPCPAPADLSSNGLAAERDAATGNCPTRVGLLPWATLGTGRLDSWGHYYRYSVTPVFSNNGSGSGSRFSLTSVGDISIKTRDASGAEAILASSVPAAIISFGKNGGWAIAEYGGMIADTSATNLDEDINGSGPGTDFYSRVATSQPTAPGGEFDDQTDWLSPHILFNRMVTTGRLP